MPGKLMYFDIGGRAEGIRAMLCHANFQYEDKRLTFEEFGALKASLPLGSMPVWEEDGFTMVQSSAILRMLGIRCGYYTEDCMTAWRIDSIVDFVEDQMGKYTEYLFPCTQGAPLNEDGTEWCANFWDKVIPVMEARLSEHGKRFLAGDKLTIADFKTFSPFGQTVCNDASPMPAAVRAMVEGKIAASPRLAAWVETMKGELANYIATRPPRPL